MLNRRWQERMYLFSLPTALLYLSPLFFAPKCARWSFIYPSLAMKLVPIYTPLHIFPCNIFIKKEKYHEL